MTLMFPYLVVTLLLVIELLANTLCEQVGISG